MTTRRLPNRTIRATYRTRAKYAAVLHRNIADRQAQTYEAYKTGVDAMGLGTMTRDQWRRAQDDAITELRAVLIANR